MLYGQALAVFSLSNPACMNLKFLKHAFLSNTIINTLQEIFPKSMNTSSISSQPDSLEEIIKYKTVPYLTSVTNFIA